MKVKDLTLAQWQTYLTEYGKSGAAFRIDGTQFSIGRHYGGFTMNGHIYTVFGYNWTGADAGAFIGVREDFLKWVTKKCKEANDANA